MENLTDIQKKFIRMAIDVRAAVVDFHGLTDEVFMEDYGISKYEFEQEILDIKSKL